MRAASKARARQPEPLVWGRDSPPARLAVTVETHDTPLKLAQRYGFDVLFLVGPTVEALVDEGMLEVSDDALTLTRRGILWGDYVGHRLIAALEAAGRGAPGKA